MKNEIPAIRSDKEMSFVRLGSEENIDLHLDRQKGTMTIEIISYDEEAEEWLGEETTVEEVKSELEKHRFSTICSFPLTIRELQACFSHKLRI